MFLGMFQLNDNYNDKARFDHLLMVAKVLPKKALPELLRAIVQPEQNDFILTVNQEDVQARRDESFFFFDGIQQKIDIERMQQQEKNKNDYPLSLATDMVLPWTWSLRRYIDNQSTLKNQKTESWTYDHLNHDVTLWLPWEIGFVKSRDNAITDNIVSKKRVLIPDRVYDMSFLFETIKSDGIYWYVNGKKEEKVSSYRSAAFFEIGRLIEQS